jgi:methionyl-tRNA synthetase
MSIKKTKDKIFIGVAWPYVNGNLHIGHVAGYLLPADITARFYRLLGYEVLMVSGSDCFGTPITVEADKRNLTPRDIVNEYHSRNKELFKNLGLSFDLYTKTDTDNHRELTQQFLLSFWNNDLLEVSKQKQYYSETLNRFLPDRYVEGICPNCGYNESRSDQCDNCGKLLDQDLINPISKIDKKPVSLRDTEHLFVKWNIIQPNIEKYVNRASKNWRSWVRGETKKWLKVGLSKRAVTRDLDWGVSLPKEIAEKLPGSEHKKVYVWFDAVIGYLSASKEWSDINKKDWKRFWYGKNIKHYYFMGKDNLVFHTVFWPGQLMTYDPKLHLPDYPAINQFLNLEGKKFSKSRGVVVDTAEFVEKYGADPLRFHLTSIMPENSDSSFSLANFIDVNNNSLVGHIGNYVHRTLSLYRNTTQSLVISQEVLNKITEVLGNSINYLINSKFKLYLEEIEGISRYANILFSQKEPWITKNIDKDKFISAKADFIILAYAIMCLLEPVTPTATRNFLNTVGLSNNEFWINHKDIGKHLNEVVVKININQPVHLFQKFLYESEQNIL